MTINLKVPDLTELKPRITVFGVGGAGGNAVNNMINAGLEGVQFVVAYAKQDFELTLAMLEQRRIAGEEMVTDVVDIDGFSRAFEALKQPTTQCKVLLEP